MGETYRTVLGHFRHEIGHYYWDRLIEETPLLAEFRTLFGDERGDYEEAQQRHYSAGPPASGSTLRQQLRVDAPLGGLGRDLGPLPAHRRHAGDGARLRAVAPTGAGRNRRAGKPVAATKLDPSSFEDLIGGWIPLTLALNSLNRSMGPATATRSCSPSRPSRSSASSTTWWRAHATRGHRKSTWRDPRAGVPRYSEALSTRSQNAVTICAAIVLGACYQTSSLRLSVRSPVSTLGCVQLANEVFFSAGYMKVAPTMGGMVYTPRGPIATAESLPMRWGNLVSIANQVDDPIALGSCSFVLQAVSADPSCEVHCPPALQSGGPRFDPTRREGTCAVACPLTAQPGPAYDQITREMGHRLETFGLSPPAAPAPR